MTQDVISCRLVSFPKVCFTCIIHLWLFFALFNIYMHADIMMWVRNDMAHFKCNTGITFFSTYSPDNSASCWHRSRGTAHRLRCRVYHGVGPNRVTKNPLVLRFPEHLVVIQEKYCGYTGVRQMRTLKGMFFFVNYLRKMQGVLTLIRTDAGTENVEIRAIQVALRLGHRGSMSGYWSVSIGRSTSNQRTIDVYNHCNGLYLGLHFP